MTAILQTKKNRPNYYVVLDYKDNTGKRIKKWISTDIPVSGNNKRKAEKRRQEVLAEYDIQDVDLSKDILFIDFMSSWLENLKHSIAPTTYEGYSLILKVHIMPYFTPKSIRLRDLTPTHIQRYINYKMRSLSPNTVIKHLRNISKCLDNAVKQNIIEVNPLSRIDMPKKVKYTGAKYYNENEIEHLLACAKDDPLEIVITLTIFYGLRRSEVLGLKWDAIDFDNNTITINHTVTQYTSKEPHKNDATKNDSSCTTVPLAKLIKDKLIAWKQQQAKYRMLQPNDYTDGPYICTHTDGKLIRPGYVSHHFNILLTRHNLIPIRFHDLRHSSASYLKYLGFDLKDIQIWLRHKDIQTTMNIYTHLDMDAKRNIADRLNDKFSNLIN